jgi:glycerophosphoryl diester phosphodiesterase
VIEWAHQGGAKEAPSNTLWAFERALRMDHEIGLELDVHLSSDEHLVLIHDATLERTTDGRGRVRRRRAAELGGMHAAWWWRPGVVDDHRDGVEHPLRSEPAEANLGVPTFEQFLELWRTAEPRRRLTIEIKSRGAAGRLAEALARCSDDERKRITVTSFRDWIIWRFRRGCGQEEVQVDLAPGGIYMVWFWLSAALGIPIRARRYARIQIPVQKGIRFVTPRLLEAARAADLAVDVWTIDDEQEMVQLIGLKVDGIMTDRPSLLRSVLARTSPGPPS